jgi:hypothetical protein
MKCCRCGPKMRSQSPDAGLYRAAAFTESRYKSLSDGIARTVANRRQHTHVRRAFSLRSNTIAIGVCCVRGEHRRTRRRMFGEPLSNYGLRLRSHGQLLPAPAVGSNCPTVPSYQTRLQCLVMKRRSGAMIAWPLASASARPKSTSRPYLRVLSVVGACRETAVTVGRGWHYPTAAAHQ